jgi:hypothetical protein
MLENLNSVSLLTIMEIIGPIILGLAIAYGIWRTRHRSKAQKAQTAEATRALYKRADDQERGVVRNDLPR